MNMTDNIYLLLGSNLGHRQELLAEALKHIELHLGEVIKTSKQYETAPWGISDQPKFLNQVVEIRSALSPEDMLTKINEIEINMGRVRHEKWGERIIDIDILYFNDLIYNSEKLIIPHPEIQNRRFTLVPLAELAPDLIHPVLLLSNSRLLTQCEDLLEVKEIEVMSNQIN